MAKTRKRKSKQPKQAQAKATSPRETLPAIDSLNYGAEWSPQERDWSEGYGDEWEYIAASRCEECDEIVLGVTDGDYPTHAEATEYGDEPSTCEGHVPGADGPMMNSLYPLELDDAEGAARAIVDLPLVVVTDGRGEVLGLALTGGGMDMSWDIAEAYMRLGYLPPVGLRLPIFAGQEATPKNRWMIEGLRRSISGARDRLDRDLEDLDNTLAYGVKEQHGRVVRQAVEPHAKCRGKDRCQEPVSKKEWCK